MAQDYSTMKTPRTYTVYRNDRSGSDDVEARGLSAVEAMNYIIARQPEGELNVYPESYESFIFFEATAVSGRRSMCNERTLIATVPITYEFEADRSAALLLIAEQFLRHQSTELRTVDDEDHDEQIRLEENWRVARRLEKELLTRIVDALLARGFCISFESDADERFAPSVYRSKDREEILEWLCAGYVLELSTIENETYWLSTKTESNGWDVVQSHSKELSALVDPIIAAYAPV